ncbi:MAG: ATP-binding cassette domain-containing protein, partial [Paludibacteraceae bacterium]|nr:ATP-binding cassette domain-containing protein [Paludibacteraceae bacterium]
MMERELFLSLENVEPRVYGMTFPSLINWEIKRGEQWAVVGANGAGKTMLADLVSGKIAKRNGEIN